jgi:putative DNA primase/helicase
VSLPPLPVETTPPEDEAEERAALVEEPTLAPVIPMYRIGGAPGPYARSLDAPIVVRPEEPEDDLDADDESGPAAALEDLAERLALDPECAFDADVLTAAARLQERSRVFQALLRTLSSAKVRIRDWRGAVRDQRVTMRRHTPDDARIDVISAGIDAVAKALLRDALGVPEKTVANLLTIFARDPRWTGVLAYHALRECTSIVVMPPWHPDDAGAERPRGDWTEQDSTRAASWLAREWRIYMHTPLVEEAIETVARRVIIDPLAGYLNELRWDGKPRIDRWLALYAGASDTPYTQAIGARWLISAVARALRPGCKVDCVLILEAKQGLGKSSMLRALCPDEILFLDDELEIGNKDAAQVLRGKWLIELGELGALSRSQLSQQKSFITRQTDTYRPSYGRRAKDFPRRCVFAGSTNEEQYLRDDENRRFWPVRCGVRIDVEGVAAVRDQLWAEAMARFTAGERWHVETPELAALCREQQERRAQPDPWEQWIGDWLDAELRKPCDTRMLGDLCECPRCRGLTTGGALSGAVGLEKAKQARGDEMRAAAVFRKLGWSRGDQARREGTRVYPYFPPSPPVAQDAASTSEVEAGR